MSEVTADVAILGSGFGGSLMALVVKQMGLQPVLIDRNSHPRFAIGESSTPIADFVLRDLARRYDLSRLKPLTKYGTWHVAYPEIVCGLKRGFSYFRQEPDHRFAPRGDHANELLVTASSDDFRSDTHWLRSDVDAFLAREVEAAGIPLYDRAELSLMPSDGGWVMSGQRLGEPLRIRARFVVDASGAAGVVLRALGVPDRADELTTHSRAVYSHFLGVRPWHDCLAAVGGYVADHPFYCDHAALHHLLDEGWMWQLRFNNGVTSAGFVLDVSPAVQPAVVHDTPTSPEEEWSALLRRYPSLAEQFADAHTAEPPGRLLRTGRLQRHAGRMVGEDWALLPHTAGFIDPLHSTGIAQTLCGIERLALIFEEHWNKPSLRGELQRYEATLQLEFALIDQLVSGCYFARHNHRLFIAFAMLYFALATTYERQRHTRSLRPGVAFLCANDADIQWMVNNVWERLKVLTGSGGMSEASVAQFEHHVTEAIRPYNHVGLCDPVAQNMYRYTAAPVD